MSRAAAAVLLSLAALRLDRSPPTVAEVRSYSRQIDPHGRTRWTAYLMVLGVYATADADDERTAVRSALTNWRHGYLLRRLADNVFYGVE